jgi:hypothetical protein
VQRRYLQHDDGRIVVCDLRHLPRGELLHGRIERDALPGRVLLRRRTVRRHDKRLPVGLLLYGESVRRYDERLSCWEFLSQRVDQRYIESVPGHLLL